MELGTCPVCLGTGRVDAGPGEHWFAGYDRETNTLACRNCGGQTMSVFGTGRVRLREDGTPCVHEFVGRNAGRCYTIYTCKHCGSSFDIDSGD